MAKYTTIRVAIETREKLRKLSEKENISMCKLIEKFLNENKEK